jgi:hypothetical protein
MVRLLDREGVIADPGLRHHLACLADDLDQADVARYLVPEGPSCAGDAALARVTARSQ